MGVQRWRGRGHYRSHLPSTHHTALPPGSHPSYTLYTNLNTIHLKALAHSLYQKSTFTRLKQGRRTRHQHRRERVGEDVVFRVVGFRGSEEGAEVTQPYQFSGKMNSGE